MDMTNQQGLTTNNAVSTREPDRVCVDERDDLAFAVTTPDDTKSGAVSPEQFYAAALASCLHQAVAVEASRLGVSTAGSRVRCSVSLTHGGNQRFGLHAELSIDLPDVDAETATQVRTEALVNCPPVRGVEITTNS